MKIMDLTTRKVENKIKEVLPDKFALVIDGWTKNSTHFVAIFVSFHADTKVGFEQVMLAFSPMNSETSFRASDHFGFIEWVLGLYGKSLDNVVAVIGDNVSTNQALADMCKKPLIGCASHRFNLAMKKFLDPFESLMSKITDLMGKLKTLKMSGKLRKFSHLRPVQRNDTCWSSSYGMLKWYSELMTFLSDSCFTTDRTIVDYLLSPSENTQSEQMLKELKYMDSITELLQSDNTDMSDVRALSIK